MAIIEVMATAKPGRSHAPESVPTGTSKKQRLCYAGGVNRPTQATFNFMGEDTDSTPHAAARAMLDTFASVGATRFGVTWTTSAGDPRR